VPTIASLLAAGGVAVFSGILDERESDARRGIEAAGLVVDSVEAEQEWRTIVAGRTKN
jgi:ribosomal protein L11 methylase PrmA